MLALVRNSGLENGSGTIQKLGIARLISAEHYYYDMHVIHLTSSDLGHATHFVSQTCLQKQLLTPYVTTKGVCPYIYYIYTVNLG